MKRARICILLALTLIFVLGFGSTAFAEEETNDEKGAEALFWPPFPPSYELSAEAVGKYSVAYDWKITKEASSLQVDVPIGEPAQITYNIGIERIGNGTTSFSVESSMVFTVTGSMGQHVEGPMKAMLQQRYGNSPWQTINEKAWESKKYSIGTHEFSYSYQFSPLPNWSYRVAYVFKNDENNKGRAEFSFPTEPSVVPITVEDVSIPSLPLSITATYSEGYTGLWENITDGPLTYTVTLTNEGNKEGGIGNIVNTASIQGEEASETVTVEVNVPKVGSGDPPEPREERKVRWPDRTPPPEELEAAADAVPLPRTGGLIEWEWVALAGGMLTGGGGALCLIRRRRIKK